MSSNSTVLIILYAIALPDILYGITTIHHDKPESSKISKMVTKMIEPVPSNTFPERHKRLLPYINYYISRNQRKQPQRDNFTPFLESNALPGPFIPIIKTNPKHIEYTPESPVTEKSPNYLEIYETLSQLKQAQQTMRQNYNQIFRKPQVNYIPIHYYQENPYRNPQPGKTYVETYTPTNIDVEAGERKKYEITPQQEYKIYRQKPQIVNSYVIDKPIESYRVQPQKTYYTENLIVRKPIVVFEQKPEFTQNEKPIAYEMEPTPKPHVNAIIDEKYVAQKFTSIENTPETLYTQEPTPIVTEKPTTYVQEYYSSPAPIVPTENTNFLAKILKQLQSENTLPQTFTPQNIDNSIRTLVKILNGLRKEQGLKTKPIVVVDDSQENIQESEEVVEKPIPEKPTYIPTTFTQSFPANTIDGGTPGRPGIDYPALSSIPQTDFNCKKQRYKGFFGDPHTNCQVWHYCDLNGGQASFLCPNGTIFSQVALTCDWWYNVKCSNTPQLYVLNERLYKYILPLTPKFPEDYNGPLVDRYLALKFQEMEEKMKKERKKDKSEEIKDDSDQLQDIINERAKSSEES